MNNETPGTLYQPTSTVFPRTLIGEDDFLALGTLPLNWLRTRRIGKATLSGTYADIYSSGWVSYLRSKLAPDSLQVGIPDIDAAVLQQASPRVFTQRASRKVYEKDQDGIYYRSRYGHNLENWAIFEPFHLSEKKTELILTPDDPDLQEALWSARLDLYQLKS